jgi:hypothetical protein
MKKLQRDALVQLIEGSAEPVLVARVDSPDWPVVLCNPAFDALARSGSPVEQPFADVIERLIGRDFALEISEAVRAGQETTLAVKYSVANACWLCGRCRPLAVTVPVTMLRIGAGRWAPTARTARCIRNWCVQNAEFATCQETIRLPDF